MCVCLFLALAFAITSLCCLKTADGVYRTKEDVATYIYKYHKLPKNFLNKKEIKALSAEEAKNYNVGGNTFENNEGLIDNPNRLKLVECDIYDDNHNSVSRGAERLVFFADGSKVFYTSDHYETFELVTALSEWQFNQITFVFAIVAGVCVLGYLAAFAFAVAVKKDGKAYIELSFEIVFAATFLIALSPLAFVVWIVQNIVEKATGNGVVSK